MLCLPGLVQNQRELGLKTFLKPDFLPSPHKQIRRNTILIAERRLGKAVAEDQSQLDLAQGSWSCVCQNRANSEGLKEQLRVPDQMPAHGVHQVRGDRILLEAVPEPPERITREFERAAEEASPSS